MKLLKGFVIQFLPTQDGVTLSKVQVSGHIGTTDDPKMIRQITLIKSFLPTAPALPVPEENLLALTAGQESAIKELWNNLQSLVKESEGIASTIT